MAANLTTSSIVDFLSSIGQSSDYATRQRLASQYGISNYSGTASQNTQLLNAVRNNYSTQSTPTATQTQNQQQYSNVPVVPQPVQQTQTQQTSYSPTPAYTPPTVNSGGLISTIQDSLTKGLITGTQAAQLFKERLAAQYGGYTVNGNPQFPGGNGQNEYYAALPGAMAQLFQGVTGKEGGQQGLYDSNGNFLRQTTVMNKSTTGNEGTSSSTTAGGLKNLPPSEGGYEILPNGTYHDPKLNTYYNTNYQQTDASGNILNTLSNNANGMNSNGTSFTYNGTTYPVSSASDADFLQNVLAPFLDTMKNQNLQINPNLDITDSEIAQILEKAKSIVHPQFAQQTAAVIDQLKSNAGLLTSNYNRDVQGAEAGFTQNLENSREAASGQGNVFSGYRGRQELNQQNAQDRSLASLSESYGSKLGDLTRSAEQALGYSGLAGSGYQMPVLNNYTSSTAGLGNFSAGGSAYTGYTPGIYQSGTLPQAETAAALSLRNQNINEASRRKAQGLSYADLYS